MMIMEKITFRISFPSLNPPNPPITSDKEEKQGKLNTDRILPQLFAQRLLHIPHFPNKSLVLFLQLILFGLCPIQQFPNGRNIDVVRRFLTRRALV